jgi:hypothetical protein
MVHKYVFSGSSRNYRGRYSAKRGDKKKNVMKTWAYISWTFILIVALTTIPFRKVDVTYTNISDTTQEILIGVKDLRSKNRLIQYQGSVYYKTGTTANSILIPYFIEEKWSPTDLEILKEIGRSKKLSASSNQ